jgi:hypothetical protein
VNARHDAAQFAREHPNLAAELASITRPEPGRPNRVRIATGRSTFPAWVLIALAVLVIVAECAAVGIFSYGIRVDGWSRYWWIAVVFAAVCALGDTARLCSSVRLVHRARYAALYEQLEGPLS